ncbi:MAG: CHAT domain-containing protein, partial [Phycisphaerales bacterium JB060]
MPHLMIAHVPGQDPDGATGAKFEVQRMSAGQFQRSQPIAVPSPVPDVLAAPGQAQASRDLRWYLEDYLAHPFDIYRQQANELIERFDAWAVQAFQALFAGEQGRDFYRDAVRQATDDDPLVITISTDDPTIASWPWEALHDQQRNGRLGLLFRVVRALNRQDTPQDLDPRLAAHGCVNVLLITARPYEADVGYRTISRPLVDTVHGDKDIRARVTILDRPTMAGLREHLANNPGHYHIVHFDGHGGYGVAAEQGPAGPPDNPALRRQRFHAEGRLILETEDGAADPVPAERFADLIREHRVPVVVLNACQSATVDEQARDAYASVAGALIQAGTRAVVAMSYSLWVTGGERFLPAFYGGLFRTGDTAEAVRLGRRAMHDDAVRVGAIRNDALELKDWMVPVIYRQAEGALRFDRNAEAPAKEGIELPQDILDQSNPYGLVGRDGPLLELSRAMRRGPAGILVWGLAGVGKTTLARGFIDWLNKTGNLTEGQEPIWISFEGPQTAESVLHTIGERLYGSQFVPGSSAFFQKLKAQHPEASEHDAKIMLIAQALHEQPRLIVWDNFETVRGVDGRNAGMPEPDRQVLLNLLAALRAQPVSDEGGQRFAPGPKVLITSRAREDWLTHQVCYRLQSPLGGLVGEERWALCRAILSDLGQPADPKDKPLADLLDAVSGHPLMMRVVLPMLADHSPATVLEGLEAHLEQLSAKARDEAGKDAQSGLPQDIALRLAATLDLGIDAVPDELRPLLIPLALHEEWIDEAVLRVIGIARDESVWTQDRVADLLRRLAGLGLVHRRHESPFGGGLYEPHPALLRHLRTAVLGSADEAERDVWGRAFTYAFAGLCEQFTDVRKPG